MILAPVSVGELIDKITILEIKSERLADPAQLANVRRELALLTPLAPQGAELDALRSRLKTINALLWDCEDTVRALQRLGDFGETFIETARAIYSNNDRRAAVKRLINELAGSEIIEEKSHPPSDVA